MSSVGWGPFENGYVPLGALKEIPGEPGDFNHAAAVDAFVAMRAACFAATGYWITVTEAYRDIDGQWNVWYIFLAGGPVASFPGNSNHGRAIAFDIGGYSLPGVWAWLQGNAWRFGFSWATGKASNENWHWEYVGPLTGAMVASITPKTQSTTYHEENIMAKRIVRCTDIANVGGNSGKTQAFVAFGGPEWDGDALIRVFHSEQLRNRLMFSRGIGVSPDSAAAFSPTLDFEEMADIILLEVGVDIRKVGVGSTASQPGGLMVDGFAWAPTGA